MPSKQPQSHTALDFALQPLDSDQDLFRWFLLCYLFGKPLRSSTAVNTWELFIEQKLDTPWAINESSEHELAFVLNQGGYARYEHVTAHGLKVCMERLIREYEGSLMYMLDSSLDEEEFGKRLQKLYGVGPKITEIFTKETEEYFARRAE